MVLRASKQGAKGMKGGIRGGCITLHIYILYTFTVLYTVYLYCILYTVKVFGSGARSGADFELRLNSSGILTKLPVWFALKQVCVCAPGLRQGSGSKVIVTSE